MTPEASARASEPCPTCRYEQQRFEDLADAVPTRALYRVHKDAAQERGRLRRVAAGLRDAATCDPCPRRRYFEALAARYEQEAEACR